MMFIVLSVIYAFFAMGSDLYAAEYMEFNTEKNIALLQNFIAPGDLVFDVGANAGKKTDLYLACGARVICIEPQPACVVYLSRKYTDNDLVRIMPIGLGAERGEFDLYICDQSSTLATFSKVATEQGRFAEHDFCWDRTVRVPVRTLDDLINFYGLPKFCKIDVENFEYEVLCGLHKPIETIMFESNSEYLEQTFKCIDRLDTLGYGYFNFVVAESSSFYFDMWYTPQEFKKVLFDLVHNRDWSEIWGLWGDVYALYIP